MIACVTVPYFAAAVERRDRTALAETPLVIGGEPWETRPVYAFSEEAAVQGVFPRMSLRRAHLLLPQARFLPANQRHYRHAAAEVLDVLSEFTPLIQPDPLWLPDEVHQRPRTEPEQQLPARYFINLEQLSWAQTLRLSQEIGRTVRTTTQLPPAIGIAADPFTAAIAATSTRPHHLLPVAEMDTQRFVTSKPLTFLPLEQETLRRLKLLGLHTIGEFMALPLGQLVAQFGREIIAVYQMVQARRPLAPTTSGAAAQERIRQEFEPPLENQQTVQALLDYQAAQLAERLQRQGQAGRTITLTLAFDGGQTQTHQENLPQPLQRARTLQTVGHNLLATFVWQRPVTMMTLTVSDLTAAVAEQLPLLSTNSPHSMIAETIHQLASRYPQAVYQPVHLGPHLLPERRFEFRCLAL